MLPNTPLPALSPTKAVTLLEVFVDNFIVATKKMHLSNLQQIFRAMLHGIHSIFPPPDVSGHGGHDSILESKIDKGKGI
eukprot:15364791-Ditylum_brightwellii.AAC.1